MGVRHASISSKAQPRRLRALSRTFIRCSRSPAGFHKAYTNTRPLSRGEAVLRPPEPRWDRCHSTRRCHSTGHLSQQHRQRDSATAPRR